jgi:hypothetical protein
MTAHPVHGGQSVNLTPDSTGIGSRKKNSSSWLFGGLTKGCRFEAHAATHDLARVAQMTDPEWLYLPTWNRFQLLRIRFLRLCLRHNRFCSHEWAGVSATGPFHSAYLNFELLTIVSWSSIQNIFTIAYAKTIVSSWTAQHLFQHCPFFYLRITPGLKEESVKRIFCDNIGSVLSAFQKILPNYRIRVDVDLNMITGRVD